MPSVFSSSKAALRGWAVRTTRSAIMIARVLSRRGPAGAIRYARLGAGSSPRIHVFGQGLTSDVPANEAWRWYLGRGMPVVIAIVGTPGEQLAAWICEVSGRIESHVLVAPSSAAQADGAPADAYSTLDALEADRADYFAIKDWAGRLRPQWDVLVLEARHALPTPEDVVRLQHAAHTYDRGQRQIGFVTPALRDNGRRILGYEWDRDARLWVSRRATDDYGQDGFSRYVLAANAHGFYATHRALEQVRFGSAVARGLSLDEQVGRMIALAWQQNIRTLAFAPIELVARGLPLPTASQTDVEWLGDRRVVDTEGRTRIIFVLTGTSISGGIRTVFEQADGFVTMGFAVEVWALEEHPDWFDLHVPVKTFANYFDMIPALRNEDAIKVATWWETAEVVWLGSVNSGVGVNYVQEFETWFYPDDAVARAAVASSYRLEMAHLTIATFQQDELDGIGVASTYIPSCFDSRKFAVLPDLGRRDDTVLAVGRSFFQKNFEMTAAAWFSLGESRPRLTLFGFEPEILSDERVEYEVRPSDERINELYNEASLFVQTSRHEGFSLPLIEAMAAGCPVITTDANGNRDFCRDDENCVIVEHDDVEGLAGAIRALMDDPDRRARLASAGVATSADYSQDVVFHRLGAFYSELA